ncbi:MAG: enoyl-CoA hydratase-related protein [Firmicutes bacterium]|nr:enoyl-CoA hydratase-related protein [Bacillota bacterium]
MNWETVRYETGGGVAVITLSRPETYNAFNQQMHRELAEALRQAERDPGVRAVVITGAGKAFCSGQDLAEVPPDLEFSDLVRRYYNPLFLQIQRLEKPVLAAVNGVAAGAGMSLALACDLRIAHEEAVFTSAFARVGLVPDTGLSYLLPRLVGLGRAMELCLLADRIDARQALELGLVNRVAPAGEFEAAWREWAERLARGPRSLGYTKRLLYHSLRATVEEQLEYEAWLQGLAGATEDAREGSRAFREKRPPEFRGQ